MLAPAPHIRITPLASGHFDVEVLPPLPEGPNHDQRFATYKEARGYGCGLRLVTGWALIDLAEAETSR